MTRLLPILLFVSSCSLLRGREYPTTVPRDAQMCGFGSICPAGTKCVSPTHDIYNWCVKDEDSR
jgi:hypothetical protein